MSRHARRSPLLFALALVLSAPGCLDDGPAPGAVDSADTIAGADGDTGAEPVDSVVVDTSPSADTAAPDATAHDTSSPADAADTPSGDTVGEPSCAGRCDEYDPAEVC